MVVTSSALSAATAARVGGGCATLAIRRGPRLVRLAALASAGPSRDGTADMTFRDELIALLRDSAEVSWREWRRGVDELDRLTRPGAEGAPRRHHRVVP
jgi:hypothetical protein